MIVRMSKLEIAGPKELLLDLLEIIRELGVFQLENNGADFSDELQQTVQSQSEADSQALSERLFLENIRNQTGEIIALLPATETRESWLDPLTILDTIAASISRHLTTCHELAERHERLRLELVELERSNLLLSAIDRLIIDRDDHDGLEFIGITLRDASFIERLRELLAYLVEGECALTTTVADDGTLIGLITTPVSRSSIIRKALSDEQLPELPFPEALTELPLPKRIRYLKERLAVTRSSMAKIDEKRERFAHQWLAFYRRLNQCFKNIFPKYAGFHLHRHHQCCQNSGYLFFFAKKPSTYAHHHFKPFTGRHGRVSQDLSCAVNKRQSQQVPTHHHPSFASKLKKGRTNRYRDGYKSL